MLSKDIITDRNNHNNNHNRHSIGLVFGANNETGRAVIEGLKEYGRYQSVYAVLPNNNNNNSNNDDKKMNGDINRNGNNIDTITYLRDGLDASITYGDIDNPNDIRKLLLETKASAIFLVTSTELPMEIGATGGYSDAAAAEYESIQSFFHICKECYDIDHMPRHIVFAMRDNVHDIIYEKYHQTGTFDIVPLDDGSIVPHYSAKGKGGQYAMEYVKDIPGLQLTCITLPFLFSNFLGFFTPLPNDHNNDKCIQWTLTACFGDGHHPIDMMSSSDLSYIVPNILLNPEKYNGMNIRLVSERISMDEIAMSFSDLFGRDVIYNPLTVQEVASLPFASASCMAQMCQYESVISVPRNVEITKEVCFPRRPQSFKDWLIIHSGHAVFQEVGLDLDSPEIRIVTVFGATSPEGTSVVKGLLADTRKEYQIRITSRHIHSNKMKSLQELDPERIEIFYANYDDVISCEKAVHGVDGVFLVTDFYEDAQRDMELEEQHAKNIIDACELSTTVRHLIFSTKESADEMNRMMKFGIEQVYDAKGRSGTVLQFEAKARAAAYARTKKLSVTYVLMPCYSETFFDMLQLDPTNHKKLILTIPLIQKNENQKVMCMSVDDLGPAVANIFDSYQVYAGHEVGLVTDFVSVSEIRGMIEEVFLGDTDIITSEEVLKPSDETASHHKQPHQLTPSSSISSLVDNNDIDDIDNNNNNEIDADNVDGDDEIIVNGTAASTASLLEAKQSYMKDLGQMFVYMSHTNIVQNRHSIAKTLKLIPSAKPLKQWIKYHVDTMEFREKLGLR